MYVLGIGTFHPVNALMCCEILLILVWNTGVLTQWYVDILNRDIQMSWGGGTLIYGLCRYVPWDRVWA